VRREVWLFTNFGGVFIALLMVELGIDGVMEWGSGGVVRIFLSAHFGPYILLAVSGRNFPFGGKIFEILTASEPRMDTNSHESALIPDSASHIVVRCDRRSLGVQKRLHVYRWTKRVRCWTSAVLTMYGVTKGVTKVTKWLKVAGGRGPSTTDGRGWTRIYRRKQSKRRGRKFGTERAKRVKKMGSEGWEQ